MDKVLFRLIYFAAHGSKEAQSCLFKLLSCILVFLLFVFCFTHPVVGIILFMLMVVVLVIPNSYSNTTSHQSGQATNALDSRSPEEIEADRQKAEARKKEEDLLLALPDQINELFSYRYTKIDDALGIEIAAYNGFDEQKVEIPESIDGYPVLRIGDSAFENSKITAVCLPDSVKEIGKHAFFGCLLLQQVQLSSSLMSIGKDAFWDCRKLAAIDLPEGLRTLEDGVFSHSGLRCICFPSTLGTIPSGCCYCCTDLTTVYIPEGVALIGSDAFAASSDGTDTLASIVIPASVIQLGFGVFKRRKIRIAVLGMQTKVESLYLRSSDWYYVSCYVLAGSEMQRFARDQRLTVRPLSEFGELNTDKAIEPMKQKMFEEARLLALPDQTRGSFTYRYKKIDDAPGIEIAAYNGSDEQKIEIPESIDGYPVLRIGDNAFENSKITAVCLPDSVKEIGKNAFSNCSLLEQVQLSSSLTVIEKYAFGNCKKITAMNLPEGLKALGRGVLSHSGISSIRFPSSLDFIPHCCCYECKNLMSVYIPEGVQRIGCEAFAVEFIAEMFTLGTLALNTLPSIVIPASVTRIDSDAFHNREIQVAFLGMQKIDIEQPRADWLSVTCYVLEGSEMQQFARKYGISVKPLSEFGELDAYKAIEPAKQEKLEEDKPEQANQPETHKASEAQEKDEPKTEAELLMRPAQTGKLFTYRYTKIDDALGIEIAAYNGSDEQKIEIPESIDGYPVLRIGDNAFKNSKITAVCLPDSVKEIGKDAFCRCSLLEQVQLSSSLMSIGKDAFWDCRKLAAIDLPEGLRTLEDGVFSCSGLRCIRFPSSLETIGESCCYNCRDLTAVYIPEGVRTIGGYAFAVRPSSVSSTLPSIVFPASVLHIGDGVVSDREIRVAFLGILTETENSRLRNEWHSACCYVLAGSRMQQFARKKQIPYRPLSEFGELDAYKAIDPAKQQMLEEAKLLEAPERERISGLFTYRYNQIDDVPGIEIVAYNGFDEQIIEIPESIDGYPVLRIGEHAFSHSKIVSIRLPDSVKEIGKHAFFGCLLLQQVQLSSSLTLIEEEAFWVCERITVMDLPEGLRTLGQGVFSYCGLKSIRFPSTLDTIPKNCCHDCRGLTSVYIPEGVHTIESRAFEVERIIARLKSIVIPTSVKRLEADAFWNRRIQIEYRAMQTAGETE